MFQPLERGDRLSDQVAEQLLRSIISEDMEPGTRLPSERELGEQFDVSRTVIREAIRDLAAQGVVEVRSGSGARVAALEASAVSQSMRLYLRGQGLTYADVNEVRFTLELEITRLAAERADEDDERALLESCVRLHKLVGATEEASREDVGFHRLIAEATHNPLFVVLLDSIGDVLLDIRRATIDVPGRIELAGEHHKRIAEAIAAHDIAAAEQAMRAHLDESHAAFGQLARTGGPR